MPCSYTGRVVSYTEIGAKCIEAISPRQTREPPVWAFAGPEQIPEYARRYTHLVPLAELPCLGPPNVGPTYPAETECQELPQPSRKLTAHHLQIIGEAARSISQALGVAHSEIPWANVIAMRNLLVHEYFGVDIEEVWSTAVNDLPLLRPFVEAMLAEVS